MKSLVLFVLLITVSFFGISQDINALVQRVKDKINLVNDYEAKGKMKTNVFFLKVPVASVKIYFRKPNQLKIKNEKGISFVPKGAVNINMNNVLGSGQYSVLDAGYDKVNGTAVKVVKLLPVDDESDVVLSTLYIDEVNQVIRKTKTTTKDNGTYELEMSYGKYIGYGLPDNIIFSFNSKNYKLPKGVTFDFDDGTDPKKKDDSLRNKKGRIEIAFSAYLINKGVADAVFK